MNWGNKLLFTFIAFAGGMGYLVYRSVTTEYQLVEKEYYKSEIAYQQVIDGSNEANRLSAPVQVLQTTLGVELRLPAEMKNKQVAGNVWFYCAYEQKNDKKISLQINKEAVQLITPGYLTPGTYTVKITWKEESRNFYAEKNLIVK
jgi:FixH